MRSSDLPSDSTDASTRESAFQPFSATSEYDCSGRRSDSPPAAQTASGKPDTAFATANGTAFRCPPPKKRRSRAGAQDPAEATCRAIIDSAEAEHDEPHDTRDSRLTEASRTVLSAIHALAANGARRTVERPDTNANGRSHDIDPRTCQPGASRYSHARKAQLPQVQYRI